MVCSSTPITGFTERNQVKYLKSLCWSTNISLKHVFFVKLFNSTGRGCKFCLQLLLEVLNRTYKKTIHLKIQEVFWGKPIPLSNVATDRHWWDIIILVNPEHTVTKYQEKKMVNITPTVHLTTACLHSHGEHKNQFIVWELKSFQNSVNPLIY